MFPVSAFGRRPGCLCAHSCTAIPIPIPIPRPCSGSGSERGRAGSSAGQGWSCPRPLLTPGWMEDGKYRAQRRAGRRARPVFIRLTVASVSKHRENGGKKGKTPQRESGAAWVVHVVHQRVPEPWPGRFGALFGKDFGSAQVPAAHRARLAPAAPGAERGAGGSLAMARCLQSILPSAQPPLLLLGVLREEMLQTCTASPAPHLPLSWVWCPQPIPGEPIRASSTFL